MSTYEVKLTKSLWTTVTVEAESEDDAIERAFDSEQLPGGLCAHCVGIGDWHPWSVDEDEWDVPSADDIDEHPVRLVESADG